MLKAHELLHKLNYVQSACTLASFKINNISHSWFSNNISISIEKNICINIVDRTLFYINNPKMC